ncbi:unnamed protein product [Arctia plantaginis]|uniref:Uncharacterized protein n=1 Tax=Arctia plantaginis TaxID=874455 RepID=A0A8S1AE82_ARCPL|nr:unnamed protein product [Arctia plantaginis]
MPVFLLGLHISGVMVMDGVFRERLPKICSKARLAGGELLGGVLTRCGDVRRVCAPLGETPLGGDEIGDEVGK